MDRKLALGLLSSICASVLLTGVPAFAYTSPGSPTGYVNDFAHVLSDATKQSLESELKSFEATTSNEIAVAIVPDMGGDYIENYAVQLFKEWGVGKRDKDNGVLLLLSIEEHKMRIEVGYGLEGALPDSVAQSILDNEMTPKLKDGDYDGAVTAGVHAIEAATTGEYKASGGLRISLKDPLAAFIIVLFAIQWIFSMLARSKSWWAGGMVGALAGLGIAYFFALAFTLAAGITIGLTFFGLLLDYFISSAFTTSKASGVRPPWWAGGGGFGGSSGTGFGGFGGGSSGGGGASGGW